MVENVVIHSADSRLARMSMRHLRAHLSERLKRLSDVSIALVNTEKEIENFLDRYYTETAPYFKELEKLQKALADTHRAFDLENAKSDGMNALQAKQAFDRMLERHRNKPTPKQHQEAIAQDMKSLYRKLVKDYHPDRQQSADAPSKKPVRAQQEAPVEDVDNEALMRMINQAYAKKNLGQMWQAAFDAEDVKIRNAHGSAERRRQIFERLEKVEEAITQLKKQRYRLEHASSAVLMQRAFEARLAGKDFFAQVITKIQRDIVQTRREVVELQLAHMSQWRENVKRCNAAL